MPDTSTTTTARLRKYFAALPPHARRYLKAVRAAIRAAAPDANEVISYSIPAFKVDGRMLVWYAAWTEHVGMYPIGPGIVSSIAAAKRYSTSKGTIRFPLNKPVPVALVKRLVRARVAAVRRTRAT